MNDMNPRSTARFAGHPIHPMLVSFPIVLLVGALVSDLAYWQTADPFWATASFYLLGAAIVMAVPTALTGFTDFFGNARIRALSVAWQHMIGNVLAVLLAVFNLLIRWEDPEANVVPVGLAISAITGLILLFTGWRGGDLVFRHRVGVSDPAP